MLLGDIIGVKEGCERVWEKKEAGRSVKVKVDVQAVWSGKLPERRGKGSEEREPGAGTTKERKETETGERTKKGGKRVKREEVVFFQCWRKRG